MQHEKAYQYLIDHVVDKINQFDLNHFTEKQRLLKSWIKKLDDVKNPDNLTKVKIIIKGVPVKENKPPLNIYLRRTDGMSNNVSNLDYKGYPNWSITIISLETMIDGQSYILNDEHQFHFGLEDAHILDGIQGYYDYMWSLDYKDYRHIFGKNNLSEVGNDLLRLYQDRENQFEIVSFDNEGFNIRQTNNPTNTYRLNLRPDWRQIDHLRNEAQSALELIDREVNKRLNRASELATLDNEISLTDFHNFHDVVDYMLRHKEQINYDEDEFRNFIGNYDLNNRSIYKYMLELKLPLMRKLKSKKNMVDLINELNHEKIELNKIRFSNDDTLFKYIRQFHTVRDTSGNGWRDTTIQSYCLGFEHNGEYLRCSNYILEGLDYELNKDVFNTLNDSNRNEALPMTSNSYVSVAGFKGRWLGDTIESGATSRVIETWERRGPKKPVFYPKRKNLITNHVLKIKSVDFRATFTRYKRGSLRPFGVAFERSMPSTSQFWKTNRYAGSEDDESLHIEVLDHGKSHNRNPNCDPKAYDICKSESWYAVRNLTPMWWKWVKLYKDILNKEQDYSKLIDFNLRLEAHEFQLGLLSEDIDTYSKFLDYLERNKNRFQFDEQQVGLDAEWKDFINIVKVLYMADFQDVRDDMEVYTKTKSYLHKTINYNLGDEWDLPKIKNKFIFDTLSSDENILPDEPIIELEDLPESLPKAKVNKNGKLQVNGEDESLFWDRNRIPRINILRENLEKTLLGVYEEDFGLNKGLTYRNLRNKQTFEHGKHTRLGEVLLWFLMGLIKMFDVKFMVSGFVYGEKKYINKMPNEKNGKFTIKKGKSKLTFNREYLADKKRSSDPWERMFIYVPVKSGAEFLGLGIYSAYHKYRNDSLTNNYLDDFTDTFNSHTEQRGTLNTNHRVLGNVETVRYALVPYHQTLLSRLTVEALASQYESKKDKILEISALPLVELGNVVTRYGHLDELLNYFIKTVNEIYEVELLTREHGLEHYHEWTEGFNKLSILDLDDMDDNLPNLSIYMNENLIPDGYMMNIDRLYKVFYKMAIYYKRYWLDGIVDARKWSLFDQTSDRTLNLNLVDSIKYEENNSGSVGASTGTHSSDSTPSNPHYLGSSSLR